MMFQPTFPFIFLAHKQGRPETKLVCECVERNTRHTSCSMVTGDSIFWLARLVQQRLVSMKFFVLYEKLS